MLHRSELVKTQLKDGIHLTIGENVFVTDNTGLAPNQYTQSLSRWQRKVIGLNLSTGFITIFRIANHLDEIIKVTERQKICLQILGTLFSFSQQVACPANDHFAAVLNEGIKRIQNPHLLGATLVNREHIDAEGSLHRSQLKELVDHNLRAGITLQRNLDTRIVRRKVTHSRDIEKNLLTNKFRNSNLQGRPVDTVRHLPNHNLGSARLALGHFHDTTHLDTPPPGPEVTIDPFKATNFTG